MSELCLYEKIESDIRTLLRDESIKPGEKIPSVNEIREKYGVSHITALRVLKELSDAGDIEFRKGKGYFASSLRNNSAARSLTGTIACVLRPSWKSNFYDNFFNDINQAVQQEAMRRRINLYHPYCNIEFLSAHPDGRILDAVKKICSEIAGDVDGYLLDERIPDNMLKELAKEVGKPLVLVGRKGPAGLDSVNPDNVNGARKAAGFCVKMGYEFFIVGKSPLAEYNSRERTGAFTDSLKDNGIKDDMIESFDFNVLPHEDTFADIGKKMRKGLKTLFFSPHDSFARALADMLHAGNFRFGEDVGVMGFEGLGYSRMKKPFVTTVDVKPELIGSTAVKILAGRINGTDFSRPECHTIESSLQMGDTI